MALRGETESGEETGVRHRAGCGDRVWLGSGNRLGTVGDEFRFGLEDGGLGKVEGEGLGSNLGMGLGQVRDGMELGMGLSLGWGQWLGLGRRPGSELHLTLSAHFLPQASFPT